MATNYDPFRDLGRVASALIDKRGPRIMPIDVFRENDHHVLSADMPGIDPGSVDIDVNGQLLTVRGERTMANHVDVKWLTREPLAGSFLRQLNLGQGIDVDNISAPYNNGVLTVTIPVTAAAKPRRIEVTTTQGEQVLQVEKGAEERHDTN